MRAPQDGAVDQRGPAEAGADGQHDRDTRAARRAGQRFAQQRRVGVVDEADGRAEARGKRAHDIAPFPAGECVEVFDPPARFVEGPGAAEADAGERSRV